MFDFSLVNTISSSPSVVRMPTDGIENRIDAYPNDVRFLEPLIKLHNWDGGEVRPLKTIAKFVKCGPFGSNLLATGYVEKGVCVIRPFNIGQLSLSMNDLAFIPENECTVSGLHLYDEGCLVFARVGNIAVGRIPKRNYKYTISPNIIIAELKDSQNPDYVCAFLSSKYGHCQLERALKIVAQPTISTDTVKNVLVTLPDSKIQEYIGQKVALAEKCRDEAEILVANAKKVLAVELGDEPSAILENVVQEGIFKNGGFSVVVDPDLIRNRLDPIGYHPELLEIQKAFHRQKPKYQRLRKLVKLSTNARSRVNSSCSFFVSVLHVDNKGYLDSQAASEYYPESPGREAKPADILVSCINPAANRIAVCDDMKGNIACSPEFAILESKELPPHYLAFVLRSDLVYRQMIHLGKGTSSSRRRIDEEELLDLEIPVVSRADEIATFIKKRQKLISIAFQLTAEAKADVEALIEGKLDTDAIMSGKLKAPTWEDIEKELEGI